MEISNSLNQPVNFYTKNTGNNIKMAIDNENQLYQTNIFASEHMVKEAEKKSTNPIRKKRKSKRLNTIDSDYFPEETEVSTTVENNSNFFIEKEQISIIEKCKNNLKLVLTKTPLINYFFLKNKKQKIQKTVESLNDITQNVDELMNTAVPYGEESNLYHDIAQNLTDAAVIIGKANKEI